VGGPASTGVRDGGTFRIAFAASDLDSLDPALSYSTQGWSVLSATCARLMTYPDKPAPEGLRVVPEVAAAEPVASRSRRTWTFKLRRGFRFSDGTPVQASAFARAIYRTLAPGISSAGAQYTRDLVGAADVQAGKTTSLSGVTARGNTLTVRFKRAVPDFAARTTMPFFCAVPPGLPTDPEGVGAFPSAGPYFVAEYRAGQRAVLERNRYYRGKRPHHVDRFVINLDASSGSEVLDRIERGTADWGQTAPPDFTDPQRRLVTKYGLNRSQFFVKPSLTLRSFVLNTSRPLFRDNARLRRAVNFAVDRRAIQGGSIGRLGSSLTDQYLSPSMPGFRNAQIYPLNGPNVLKAKSLARGHTRGGKATLYTFDAPPTLAIAQVVRQNLAKIGLDVVVKAVPPPAYFSSLGAPRQPYDIAFLPWLADYADPYGVVNLLLDGQYIGRTNYSRFNSPTYNRALRHAASLRGYPRYRTYGKLDIKLARDAAPIVAIDNINELTLVSKRVGCVVLRPSLDLAAVCLK
jgi:peptide/nickel transport system substrate-binding protein